MFWIDYWYLILVMPAVIFSIWASIRVNTTFDRYAKKHSMRGMTGAQAAKMVLEQNGVNNVAVSRVSGKLTDHYDPRNNTIFLSENVYDSTSCAAIGVAAHEAGHAVQHAENYFPIRVRSAIIPITNIGSRLALPLILLGLLLMSLSEAYIMVAYIGVACFGLSTLFQLVTLPTEFNASSRALHAIEQVGILSTEETKGARKVLSAAALTYVAALAVSLMQMLRLLLIVSGNRRR